MPSQRGRDLLLKIGDGADPEVFTTLGAARAVSMVVNNNPADSTAMDSDGFQEFQVNAGVQSLELALEGLFKDAAAEETLRLASFSGAVKNYRLMFPNGNVLEAAFIVADYRRGGSYDGLESFSVSLLRTGGGVFI